MILRMTRERFEAISASGTLELVTDLELAQLRRSLKLGADGLSWVAEEQYKRGLLRRSRFAKAGDAGMSVNGFWPEKKKRLKDYTPGHVSPHVPNLTSFIPWG